MPRGLRNPLQDGELSMRVATISLFALAIVVVAIAFVVNRSLSDDGDTAPAALTPTPTAAPTQAPAATPTAAPTQAPAATPTSDAHARAHAHASADAQRPTSSCRGIPAARSRRPTT